MKKYGIFNADAKEYTVSEMMDYEQYDSVDDAEWSMYSTWTDQEVEIDGLHVHEVVIKESK